MLQSPNLRCQALTDCSSITEDRGKSYSSQPTTFVQTEFPNRGRAVGILKKGTGHLWGRMIHICWELLGGWQEHCVDGVQALQGYAEDKRQDISHFRG